MRKVSEVVALQNKHTLVVPTVNYSNRLAQFYAAYRVIQLIYFGNHVFELLRLKA
jgi:hypothetical protein